MAAALIWVRLLSGAEVVRCAELARGMLARPPPPALARRCERPRRDSDSSHNSESLTLTTKLRRLWCTAGA